jgi:hypothetical protein
MRSAGIAAVTAVAAVAVTAAVVVGDGPSGTTAAAASRIPRASHVFVLVGENTSLGQLTTAVTRYIAGPLRRHSAWLVGYRGLAHSGSTGDYIEMTSGQVAHCERANSDPVDPRTHKVLCRQDVNNIFNQLQRHDIPWAAWAESMPHPCGFFDAGSNSTGNHYIVHHNPAVYYRNIAATPVCRYHNLPMGTTARNDTSRFEHRLARGRVPRFNFIVPNDCQDGHRRCGSAPKPRQFDAFVKREVRKIKASPAWNSRSVIVVTWDEHGGDVPDDLRVGSIWYGRHVKPGAFVGSWTHAGLLRTLEDMLRLRHLAGARTAEPITSIWR